MFQDHDQSLRVAMAHGVSPIEVPILESVILSPRARRDRGDQRGAAWRTQRCCLAGPRPITPAMAGPKSRHTRPLRAPRGALSPEGGPNRPNPRWQRIHSPNAAIAYPERSAETLVVGICALTACTNMAYQDHIKRSTDKGRGGIPCLASIGSSALRRFFLF